MDRWIAAATLLVVLVVVNVSILSNERQLAEGAIVYLELAPVDPRSLMQGDYMALRFGIANQVRDALPKDAQAHGWRRSVAAADGYVRVTLDERRVATFAGIDAGKPLGVNELLLRYRVRNGMVQFATNAFFFQEGQANVYGPARYGRFRVAADGELLLESMHGNDLARLGPAPG